MPHQTVNSPVNLDSAAWPELPHERRQSGPDSAKKIWGEGLWTIHRQGATRT